MPRKLSYVIIISLIIFQLFTRYAIAGEYYKLYIKTDPADAEITIRNIRPKFQQGIALIAGRYEILVTRHGYKPHREWIFLKSQATTITVNLIALTRPEKKYTLQLDITPANAQVQLTNSNKQVINYQQGLWLSPDRYELHAYKKGYPEQRQWFTIQDSDAHLKIRLDSQPLAIEEPEPPVRYALHINPQPNTASIALLNQKMTFQQGILLKPGRYLLQLSQNSYPTRQEWIEIFDEDLNLNVVLSKPKMCFSQGNHYLVLEFFGDVVEGTYTTASDQYYRLKGVQQAQTMEINMLALFVQNKVMKELNTTLLWQAGDILLVMGEKQLRFKQLKCTMDIAKP
ncbi:hypothetical protein [Beggiatoa leptomitoformis]|uniref:PEGA domain-containing protein n=1 Tax=Beggiatoa leptomitoformis TaxID=288004 RepID=A0A2N9YE15_9GAMM|nr:hypothetical protein [Beggiatoa leptomitoformis]AUI68733.1 hypothetical protein BLE401_08450 [Beggiatoa leptomitoformis]QGX03801.1 hypothetical protein AL038_19395 [Beggiatoa leptomitoformis]